MVDVRDERKFLGRVAMAVAGGAVAVVVCYLWIDRPVALWVERTETNKVAVFRWLTYPPPVVQTWSPAILAVLVAMRGWGRWQGGLNRGWMGALAVGCVSLIVADQFRTSLGDLCGRYWPETWHDDNPSLIGTGMYGFHPFAHGDDVGSFPSGHATRVAAMAGAWWLLAPASRWLCVVAGAPMVASLVAMNYHFVGDCVAGSVLGGIVAGCVVRYGGAQRSEKGAE